MLLAMGVILIALTLARGSLRLASRLATADGDSAGALWALDRLSAELNLAGLGVPPAGAASSPDEAIEYFDEGCLGIRGDLDGADPAEAVDPEPEISGVWPTVTTANDEVLLFYRRTGSRGGRLRARFEADLDSPMRTTRPDGSELAARDGLVDPVDAGPYAAADDSREGTFYRVSFVHDARKAGSGRFRVVQPLQGGVARLAFRAWDAAGDPVPPCGGADDAASRACRASIRRVAVEVVMAGSGRVYRREYTPPGLADPEPR